MLDESRHVSQSTQSADTEEEGGDRVWVRFQADEDQLRPRFELSIGGFLSVNSVSEFGVLCDPRVFFKVDVNYEA